jgi:hypothetical protein
VDAVIGLADQNPSKRQLVAANEAYREQLGQVIADRATIQGERDVLAAALRGLVENAPPLWKSEALTVARDALEGLSET